MQIMKVDSLVGSYVSKYRLFALHNRFAYIDDTPPRIMLSVRSNISLSVSNCNAGLQTFKKADPVKFDAV